MTREVTIRCDLCGTEPEAIQLPPGAFAVGHAWMIVTVHTGEPLMSADLCPTCAGTFTSAMKKLGPSWVQNLIMTASEPEPARGAIPFVRRQVTKN
jgi:hypothetical protein